MRRNFLAAFAALLALPLAAQTVNPNQIRPGAANGEVLTTVTANQPPSWQQVQSVVLQTNSTPNGSQAALNFSNTTPKPPPGYTNVLWQNSGANESAYVAQTSSTAGAQCFLGTAGLVGAFTDSSGIVKQPLCIGNGPTSLQVPTGATQLLLGVDDNKFSDNGGSFIVSASVNGGTATQYTVQSTSEPWDVTTNPTYTYGTTGGTAPILGPTGLNPGDTVTITYVSGTVSCFAGTKPNVDANGYLTTPPGNADCAGGPTGTYVDPTYGKFPTYYMGSGGGSTFNALTAAATGGAAPGTTFNGSAPVTFDYHSFGAAGISGTPATGNCVDWASANTLGDAGSPCGAGSGGVTQITGPSSTVTGAMTFTGAGVSQSGNTFTFSGGGGTPKVIYASQISGVTTGVNVSAGASATGTIDSATAINAAISGGNVDLEVDSGFALSTSLVIYSNTTIHCTTPQNGFIMQASSNAPVIVNAHQTAPTTASGTGGYLVSNQGDSNIRIIGCMLNANSVQAVTGSGNVSGTPHTTNPATGLGVYGVELASINGVVFDNNELYDTGEWGVASTNDSNVIIDDNYFHDPTPLVQLKNTSGVEVLGPELNVQVNGNTLTTGDDGIEIATEGCLRGGEPDCQIPNWKWGPIQYVNVENNTFVNSDQGILFLSASELLDQIDIGNTHGNVCGNGLVGEEYASIASYGSGNIGTVNVHGWSVQTSGTCNNYSGPYNIVLGLSAKHIIISGLRYINPAVTWPILTVQSGQGVIQTLDLTNWQVTTATSTFSPSLVYTGSNSVDNLVTDNFLWNDSVGTGLAFGGSGYPLTHTCSNYGGRGANDGPGFGGYSGAVKNGDCFPATFSATWPPSAPGPTFSSPSGTIAPGTTVTATCPGSASPWVSLGTTPVAGATGIAITGEETLYGFCEGDGYLTTGSATYNASGFSIPNSSHLGGSGTSVALPAFSSNLTPGSIIVVHQYAGTSGSFPPPTDTAGNTYVDCGSGQALFGSDPLQCFYALNTGSTASDVVTIHATNSSSILSGSAFEVVGGAPSSPIDVVSIKSDATGGAAGANNLVATSLHPTVNGDLIVAFFASNQGATVGTSPIVYTGINSGWAELSEYFIQNTAATITPTASDSTSSDPYGALVIAIKP